MSKLIRPHSTLRTALSLMLFAVNQLYDELGVTDPDVANPDFLDQYQDIATSSTVASVLTLFTALELVFKQVLIDQHWSLIFDDVSTASIDSFNSGNFVSVGFNETIKRLIGICGLTFTAQNLAILERLRLERNRIVHFGYFERKIVLPIFAEAVYFTLNVFFKKLYSGCLTPENRDVLEEIRRTAVKVQTYADYLIRERGPILQDAKAKRLVWACCHCQEYAVIVDKNKYKCLWCGNIGSESDLDWLAVCNDGLGRFELRNGFYTCSYEEERVCPQCQRDFMFLLKNDDASLWVCMLCNFEDPSQKVLG